MIFRIATLFRVAMPFLAPPEDGGAGGGGTGDDQKPVVPGDGSVKPGAASDTNPDGTPKAKVTTGTPSSDDARTAGMLKDLQTERKNRQTLESQVATMRSELETATKRIHALAGVNPPSQQDADEQAIKDALIKRFPVLAKLTDENLDKILGVAEKADSIEESNVRQWTNHARQMLDGVIGGVAKEIGGTLTDRQKANLQTAYLRRAETDKAFYARHEQGDKTLIDEFVKEFVEDWFEPARRRVTADEQSRRRRVPSARDRSTIGGEGKKIDFNNPKAVEDAMVESFRSHGGSFGD